MKKSLLALAVLGAFAGVASAQSSVTLFGTVDLSAKYVKNDGQSRRVSLAQDGINSSQLGFRGVEDLGGGLKASFVLLSGVSADTGRDSGETAGKTFNRKATLGLSGGFGEVRLGRDYTPTFWNNTIFDAFGTNGAGNSLNIQQIGNPFAATLGVNTTFVRADNTIGYFLPSNIGGVYGQGMVAAGEGVNSGKYVGGRVGFAAGPFDIAGAYAQQSLNGSSEKQKTYNVGGSYDFGAVKLMGYFDRDTVLTAKESRYSLSLVAPFGQNEIHAGFESSKLTNGAVSNTVRQFAVGYVYSLSKRTAVYGNVASLKNGSASQNVIGGGVTPITAGGKSTGLEVGLRHFF
jgi:predicted porin